MASRTMDRRAAGSLPEGVRPECHHFLALPNAPASLIVAGRTSLVDLFQEVSSSRFPVTIPTVSVYARLTDAEGFYVLMLDVVRRDDLLEVARVAVGDFEATDPLEDAEIMVHQIGLRLPSAGAYDIRLWANAHFVHSVSFRVQG